MNPIYQQLYGGASSAGGAPSSFNFSQQAVPQFRNPVQQMQYLLQAMSNPAAFMRQHFPDIPENISNDPGQIFNYLQRTRNPVSSQDVQQAQQMTGQIIGTGTVR